MKYSMLFGHWEPTVMVLEENTLLRWMSMPLGCPLAVCQQGADAGYLIRRPRICRQASSQEILTEVQRHNQQNFILTWSVRIVMISQNPSMVDEQVSKQELSLHVCLGSANSSEAWSRGLDA